MIQYNDKAFIWADINKVEPGALQQIKNISEHPRLFKHVAAMADIHVGIGATIGSVIPLMDAVIPSAVGVDVGCGLCAIKTDFSLRDFGPQDNKEKIFHSLCRGITENVPRGFRHRENSQLSVIHANVPEDFLSLVHNYESESIWNQKAIINQLGTLGGGNHFIEIQTDESNRIWIMIHSGSRNIGNKIATTFVKMAKEKANASPDLEYLSVDSQEGKDYLQHVKFATDFAYYNRLVMMESVLEVFQGVFGAVVHDNMINIHHNYVQKELHFGEEVWVHRKGATRVTPSITGIIPGSMGTSSYIVTGTGNADSFNSCSHGAGRVMSRTAARGRVNRKNGQFQTEGVLTVEDFKNDMNGVFSHDIDRSHLDEAPRAYKDIDEVMANQKDLVNIVTKLTPILNVKG